MPQASLSAFFLVTCPDITGDMEVTPVKPSRTPAGRIGNWGPPGPAQRFSNCETSGIFRNSLKRWIQLIKLRRYGPSHLWPSPRFCQSTGWSGQRGRVDCS